MPRRASSFENFDLSSGARNLFLGRFTERVSAHRQRHLQFAVTQYLHLLAPRAHNPEPAQHFRSDCVPRWEGIQGLDVHDRKGSGERARKTPFGQTAMQRHLAPFEARSTRIPATGLLPPVAGARGLAELRTHASPHAYLAMTRAARR